MSTQTAKTSTPLVEIVRNAAGPDFNILAINDGCIIYSMWASRPFEVARIRESDKEIRLEENPGLATMPKDMQTNVRNAIERIRANYHHHSCEPDGRGHYD